MGANQFQQGDLLPNQLQGKFERLSSPKKVHILWKALDHMQTYNGRTKLDAIALAMGYLISMGTPGYYYIHPKTNVRITNRNR